MALAVFATGFLDSWGMPLMAGLVALGLIALLLLIGATAFTVLGFRAATSFATVLDALAEGAPLPGK